MAKNLRWRGWTAYCILLRFYVKFISMRILLITDHHEPTGGAERHFFELKSRLQQSPDLQVCSLGFAEQPTETKDAIILKRPATRAAQFLSRFFFYPFLYLRLRKHIAAFKPDVIHLHNIKVYTRTLLRVLKDYPLVQTVHDYTVICPTGWNVHRDLSPCLTGVRRKCFWQHQTKFSKPLYLAAAFSQQQLKYQLQKTVKQFIAPSPLLADYLRANHFHAVTTIAPFIEHHHPFPQSSIKPFHFLYAGQLAAHKGIHHLLREFAKAVTEQPNLFLTLIGEGNLREELKQYADSLGIHEHLRWLGWQQDLSFYYAEAVAVIFPSIGMESFGLVMTESMSRARPVIATNRGHAPCLVRQEQTGLLYDPLQEGALARCMIKLANQPEFAQQLGENAYQHIRQVMDNELILKQHLQCYQTAIKGQM